MVFTGKEKTLVAAVGGAVTAAATSALQFVPLNGSAAHVLTAVVSVIGFVATATQVYITPNTKVGEATTAIGEAVQSIFHPVELLPTYVPPADPATGPTPEPAVVGDPPSVPPAAV